jgi:hypothetical protein
VLQGFSIVRSTFLVSGQRVPRRARSLCGEECVLDGKLLQAVD